MFIQGQIAITKESIKFYNVSELTILNEEFKSKKKDDIGWYARKEDKNIIYYKWCKFGYSLSENYCNALKKDGWDFAYRMY